MKSASLAFVLFVTTSDRLTNSTPWLLRSSSTIDVLTLGSPAMIILKVPLSLVRKVWKLKLRLSSFLTSSSYFSIFGENILVPIDVRLYEKSLPHASITFTNSYLESAIIGGGFTVLGDWSLDDVVGPSSYCIAFESGLNRLCIDDAVEMLCLMKLFTALNFNLLTAGCVPFLPAIDGSAIVGVAYNARVLLLRTVIKRTKCEPFSLCS